VLDVRGLSFDWRGINETSMWDMWKIEGLSKGRCSMAGVV